MLVYLLAYTLFAFAIIGITRIPWCIRLWRRHRKSRQSGSFTRRPVVPEWLEEEEVSRVQLPRTNCHVFCKPFAFECVQRGRGEKRKEAVEWARTFVGRYEGAALRIPDDCCVVSVPMRNFKCGSHPCEFLLEHGPEEDASEDVPEFLYQMHGDQRIQVVTYIEDGTAYCAGYCIYIRRPYEKRTHYRSAVIEHCYEAPKYRNNRETFAREMRGPPPRDEPSVAERTQALKTNYCPRLGQPVMIGLEDGRVSHFEWSPAAKAFKTSECAECKMHDDNAQPPPYEEIERN